jgi:NTE family protein
MARRPWTMSPGALAAALLPAGTISTAMITDGIGPLFGSAWPASPLWICAVRLDDGRRVVFGRDDVGSPPPMGLAVAASCAIPAFFEPVTIGGARYVDGGVHSPTNLDVLGGLGLDLVVVSSPMSIAGRLGSLRPGANALPIRRACRALLDREAIGVRRRGTPVIAFQPTAEDAAVMGVNAMDPDRRAAVSQRVRESTARRLERPDVRARLEPLVGRR